jgi:hypothetical protein
VKSWAGRCLLLLICLSIASKTGALPDSSNQPSPFSQMAPGAMAEGWRVSGLRGVRETAFRLTEQAGRVVVEARSDNGAAALVYELDSAGTQYTTISWSWRIENHLRSGDLQRKDGDDYPARLYVMFEEDPARLPLFARMQLGLARLVHGPSIPLAALCYVWDRDAKTGTLAPNAFTEHVKMIVVRSGGDVPSEWKVETRDLRADYRRAFGSEAPPVSGVGISSDTDNTGESAVAWFGDVVLSGPVERP